MKTLRDLFLTELADMYDAERRILRALPEMSRLVTCDTLTRVILSYLKETEGHVTKLEQVFQCFDQKPWERTCKSVVGLLDEAEEITSSFKGTPTINSAVIASARKIGHYQIAAYGCLHEWAQQLGNKAAADLLQVNLFEGLAVSDDFTLLAHRGNAKAPKKSDPNEGETWVMPRPRMNGTSDGNDTASKRRLIRVH